MARLELYPFRFRDPRTGKWVHARYKAELSELQQRYAEWEITGEPEIRDVREGSTDPFRPPATGAQDKRG